MKSASYWLVLHAVYHNRFWVWYNQAGTMCLSIYRSHNELYIPLMHRIHYCGILWWQLHHFAEICMYTMASSSANFTCCCQLGCMNHDIQQGAFVVPTNSRMSDLDHLMTLCMCLSTVYEGLYGVTGIQFEVVSRKCKVRVHGTLA